MCCLFLFCVEEYISPTSTDYVACLLRHLNAVLIGAPCTGGSGENGFSRKKLSPKRSPTLFGPRLEGTILEFFFEIFALGNFP